MKRFFLILFIFSLFTGVYGQDLIGAWESLSVLEDGQRVKSIVVLTEDYQVMTKYEAETGNFIMTNGGAWTQDGDTVTETIEFDSDNPERVGSKVSFQIYIDEKSMGIVGDELVWTRIDNGMPGKLQGAWLISGRKKDGEIRSRDISRPRKTMKILSGTRFQWIAYNTETKQFMGTGGGTYTTVNGRYTENIEFFSKDVTRVGASLDFDFELVDGQWHHSGLSSKGKPIYEIWSLRD